MAISDVRGNTQNSESSSSPLTRVNGAWGQKEIHTHLKEPIIVIGGKVGNDRGRGEMRGRGWHRQSGTIQDFALWTRRNKVKILTGWAVLRFPFGNGLNRPLRD